MNEFKKYHPIVNFVYFVFLIGFSCVFMHPLCLVMSLSGGFVYSLMLKGKGALKTNLLYILPILIIAALINPAFNHEGATIIKYLPSGNPLTLESVVYGVCAAAMLASVICWFSCFNEIMTSDKIICVFGKVIPALSLIISMTLRFVPKFSARIKSVSDAQKCIGRDASYGSIIKRAKNGLNILSIMITWSLESAIETADSMKSRGYGLPGRTAYTVFKFDKRDIKALSCIVILGTYVFFGGITKNMSFRFFPSVKGNGATVLSMTFFVAYFLLCICPIIIEVWEDRRWKALMSKI